MHNNQFSPAARSGSTIATGVRSIVTATSTIRTERLELVPIPLALVEAIFADDRAAAERTVHADLPDNWPNRALIERAFSASLERVREDPETRLWGDRLIILRAPKPRVVGSVIFHGRPDANGTCEVGYGVEDSWQGNGLATEATRACVDWALGEGGARLCVATTPPWHLASVRVLEKSGFSRVRVDSHEALGEVLVFERLRESAVVSVG